MGDQVAAMFQAIAYMEEHLDCTTSIAQIADAAGYSLFHFIRTFNRVVHYTPYDYLMRRRLSEAARLLAATDWPISAIAQEFCFSTQESFARAFRRMFSLQPSQWRSGVRNGAAAPLPPMSLADLAFMNSPAFHFPVLEQRLGETFCGLMAPLADTPAEQLAQRRGLAADLQHLAARRCMEVVAVTMRPAGAAGAYLFVGLPQGSAGVSLSPPLVSLALPAGSYVTMAASGAGPALLLNYLYSTWLPRMHFSPAAPLEIVYFALDGPEPAAAALHIPVATCKAGSG